MLWNPAQIRKVGKWFGIDSKEGNHKTKTNKLSKRTNQRTDR